MGDLSGANGPADAVRPWGSASGCAGGASFGATGGGGGVTHVVKKATAPMGVLQECIDLMERKAADYQNPNSSVKQAMYYEGGVSTLYDIINAKRLRIRSLMEAYAADATTAPKNEALEDSFKDIINYCAFAVAWLRGQIEGQDPERDMLNRPKQKAMGLFGANSMSRSF